MVSADARPGVRSTSGPVPLSYSSDGEMRKSCWGDSPTRDVGAQNRVSAPTRSALLTQPPVAVQRGAPKRVRRTTSEAKLAGARPPREASPTKVASDGQHNDDDDDDPKPGRQRDPFVGSMPTLRRADPYSQTCGGVRCDGNGSRSARSACKSGRSTPGTEFVHPTRHMGDTSRERDVVALLGPGAPLPFHHSNTSCRPRWTSSESLNRRADSVATSHVAVVKRLRKPGPLVAKREAMRARSTAPMPWISDGK